MLLFYCNLYLVFLLVFIIFYFFCYELRDRGMLYMFYLLFCFDYIDYCVNIYLFIYDWLNVFVVFLRRKCEVYCFGVSRKIFFLGGRFFFLFFFYGFGNWRFFV